MLVSVLRARIYELLQRSIGGRMSLRPLQLQTDKSETITTEPIKRYIARLLTVMLGRKVLCTNMNMVFCSLQISSVSLNYKSLSLVGIYEYAIFNEYRQYNSYLLFREVLSFKIKEESFVLPTFQLITQQRKQQQ